MPREPRPFRIDLRDCFLTPEQIEALGVESHHREAETAIVRVLKREAVEAYEARGFYRPSVRVDGGSTPVRQLVDAGLLLPNGDPLVWSRATRDQAIGRLDAAGRVEIVGYWRLEPGLHGRGIYVEPVGSAA